jgi:anti-sigma factor RsiW
MTGEEERPLSSDRARELFSDAFEGTLEEAAREAFEEALERDPVLRKEWESFQAAMKLVARVGASGADLPAPELLPKVQSKLRRRSRGRYYRDRFAEQAGAKSRLALFLAILLMAFVLVAAWAAIQWMTVIGTP